MRILQVFNRYLERGGEDASVDRVAGHLGERHGVVRCEFRSEEWIGSGAPPRWRQPFLLWRNPESLGRVGELIARHRPDCVLLHNPYPVGSAGLYRTVAEAGVPLIQYLHNFRPFSVNGYLWTRRGLTPAGLDRNFLPEVAAGSWQESVPRTALYALVLWMLHRRGDFHRVAHWVAISEFLRDKVVGAGVPSARVSALRHSWDARPAPPAPRDDGGFLFLGRLIEAKGVIPLIEAWRELEARRAGDCPRLVIAGEGPLDGAVRRMAEGLRSVSVVGRVDGAAKADLIESCRAVVVPSLWWEPLGIVVYEAYDAAKPVLAAHSGGLTETVQDGVTGLLHEPGDVGGLAGQVGRLADTPDEAAAMGRAGRAWLLANTRKEEWNRRMDAILEGVGAR